MVAQTQENDRPQPPFVWDKQKAEIALFVFEGRYTHQQIAETTHIALRTLEKWIAHPAFQERLEGMRDNLLGSLMEPGALPYVTKAQRIIALSQMAEMARLEFERNPTVGTPGGEILNLPAFNAFRACLNDIAKELGERSRRDPIMLERVDPQVVFYMPEEETPPEE